MDPDVAAEMEYELVQSISSEVSKLERALIYEDEIDTWSFDRRIAEVDMECLKLYFAGREVLDRIEEINEYRDILEHPEYTESSEKFSIREDSEQWFIVTDPGEYTDLITEHDKDLERSEPRYEGRVIGTELRKWLEEYEELRMDARKMEVYEFKPLNDLLIDEEFGEELVEGEDAAVIQ